jgi:hypothetical protein
MAAGRAWAEPVVVTEGAGERPVLDDLMKLVRRPDGMEFPMVRIPADG